MGCCQSIHSKKRKDDAVAEYGDVVYHDVMNYLDRPDQFTTPEYKFEACSGAGIVYNVDQVAELTDESGLFYVFLDKAIKPGQRLAFVS
ncbi:hypothetical protein HDE_13913 [Halotydeus destructor]|nr:hypothetical protein HDE_13913 [Halotydeus destructor]